MSGLKRDERGGAQLGSFQTSARGVLTSADAAKLILKRRQERALAARQKLAAMRAGTWTRDDGDMEECDKCGGSGKVPIYDADGDPLGQMDCPDCGGGGFNGSEA